MTRACLLLLVLSGAAGCDFGLGPAPRTARDVPIAEDAKVLRAALEIQRLEAEVLEYQTRRQEWPDGWRALGRAGHDPWGEEYVLDVVDDRPVVWSCGPDREPGTDDDVYAALR